MPQCSRKYVFQKILQGLRTVSMVQYISIFSLNLYSGKRLESKEVMSFFLKLNPDFCFH